MKEFDKKDVFDCTNAEKAKEYIGKLGYPSNSLNKLKTLINNFAPYSLDKIDLDNDKPFFYRDDCFLFFLPAEKVKEVENHKKGRPFKNCDEFLQRTKITVGTVIHIEISPKLLGWRSRFHLALLGYTTDTLIFPSPLNEISFQTLFNEVQLVEEDETLQPFGIEEAEETEKCI